MNSCWDCDIAFIGRNCPLCLAKERIEELEKELEELEK